MRAKPKTAAAALLLALFSAACSLLNAPERNRGPLPVTFDGLMLVPNPDGIGSLYLRQNHQIGSYDAFQIDPVTVAYRRETRVPPRPDTERMRRHLEASLAQGIEHSGVPISRASGPCVLRVGVQLIDTELFAISQASQATTSFVKSWGHFVLVHEIRDSVSGESLVRYVVKRGIPGGAYHGASGSRDWGAIERSLDRTLEDLRLATSELLPPNLGEAREGCSGGLALAAQRSRQAQPPAAPAR